MPLVMGDELHFVYLCDPTTILRYEPDTESLSTVAISTPGLDLSDLRGGSQLVPAGDGWLAVVHEVVISSDRRWYLHRFVRFDEGLRIAGVSDPFVISQLGYEFAAGLARFPGSDRLLLSYGVWDREAWIAELDLSDVLAMTDA
jgi:hypothetical protein